MKKWLSLFVVVLALFVCVTGCGENTKAGLEKDWESVKDEYTKIEEDAQKELDKMEEVSQEEIEELVKTVKEKYAEVKDGVTKENEEVAKELYKAAHELELLSEKSKDAIESEAVTLGKDAKEFVKDHYSDVEKDFDKVKENIEAGVKSIEQFTEEQWNNFLGLFHQN